MKNHATVRGEVVMTGLSHLVLLVLMALAGVALYAPIREHRMLRHEVEEARRRLDEQQILFPLYAELASLDTPARWSNLQLPEPDQLTERDVVSIPERFKEIAARCSVELSSVSPRVVNDEAAGRRLRVDLQATGSYQQLHPLLIELIRMPVLAGISRIEVRREVLNEVFNIQVNLALE